MNGQTMTDLLLAAESVIDDATRDVILARFPSQKGATVADLLDMAGECDWGLGLTEPWYDEHAEEAVTTVRAATGADESLAARAVGTALLTLCLAVGEEGTAPPVDAVRDLAGSIIANATATL